MRHIVHPERMLFENFFECVLLCYFIDLTTNENIIPIATPCFFFMCIKWDYLPLPKVFELRAMEGYTCAPQGVPQALPGKNNPLKLHKQ